MYALEHDEILRRVAGLADKDPNASVYCVDAVGAHFVDIPEDIAQEFSWTVSADSPLDLMAPNFRLAGSTLFRMCRQDGSAIGIVRMADRPEEDVELHLFNAGDFVTGVIVDIQSQRPAPPSDLPQSTVETQRNAVISAGAAAAAAASVTEIGTGAQQRSARDRWQAWETRAERSAARSAPRQQEPARPEETVSVRSDSNDRETEADPPMGPLTMYLHTDAAGVISYADDDALLGLGRDRNALIGSRIADYVHRDDKVVASMEWADLLATPHSERSFRAHYLRGDGKTIVLDRTDTNRLDTHDNIVQIKLVESGATVSDAQREFQTKLLAAVSADPASAVAYVNHERKVGFANSEWTRVTWLSQGSPISGLDEKLVDANDFRTAIDRSLRNDRRSNLDIALRTGPDGGRFSANADVAPLRGPDGNHGALITLTKIAQINAAQAARQDEDLRERRAPTPSEPRKERKAVAIAGVGAAAGVAGSEMAGQSTRSGVRPANTEVMAVTPGLGEPPPPPMPEPESPEKAAERKWWTWPRLIVAATAMTALAGFLRFWMLDRLPPGMSELEALSALEAQRILDQPALYSTVGFGQPLGPMYVFGFAMRLFGDSLLVMRGVSAVVGTITVLSLFWFCRRYGGWAATVAAAALGAMVWHLHYSRVALGVIWWPLFVVAFLWVIAALFDKELPEPTTESYGDPESFNTGASENSGRRRGRFWRRNKNETADEVEASPPKTAKRETNRAMFWRWIVGGIVLGGGVYFANAHWLLLIVLPIIMLPWAIFGPRVRRRGGFAGWLTMTVIAALVATPMALRLNANGRQILDSFSAVDARGSNWSSLSFTTQLQELARWWGQTWVDLLGGRSDLTDALGAVAPVHLSILIAAAAGLLVLLIRYQNGTTWIIVAILLVAPFGAALTNDSIGLRPSTAMAPILALLAGVGVGWLADRFGRDASTRGFLRGAMIALPLAAVMVGFSVDDYFWRFENKTITSDVYSEASDKAMAAIDENGAFVNFYSGLQRWEGPRRNWQAPGVSGVDRSSEFSSGYSVEPTPNQRPQLFVLLDNYVDDEHIGDVLSRYPTATIKEGSVAEGFVVIEVSDPT